MVAHGFLQIAFFLVAVLLLALSVLLVVRLIHALLRPEKF